jgi:oligopeptide/dipeptide ABC transporter ATP-binding protein
MRLLEIDQVAKSFRRGRATVRAVDGVTLGLDRGETLGIIGESGSGKSTLGRLAVGLLAPDAGAVGFDGADLAGLSRPGLRRLRSDIQVVFQEPFESLDPKMAIIDIVREPLEIHRPQLPAAERRRHAYEVLDRVSLPSALRECRPAQLSGGEQQRVGIARAIVTRPRLLLLDEPTSSLDLSLRAGILQLLLDLQQELGLAYLFVSHDMSTIEYVSDRIAVMYRGRIVEEGPAEKVVSAPRHPYTRLLMDARLPVDPRQRAARPPALAARPPAGEQACIFYPGCPIALPVCGATDVELASVAADHLVACLRAGEPGIGPPAPQQDRDGTSDS